MASELKENEEGMTDILRTNDSVLRVMDLYKSKMGNLPELESGGNSSKGATGTTDTASKDTPTDGQGKTSEEPAASAQNGATGGAGGGSDVLIDLADLNFGATPVSGAEGGLDLNSSLGLGSLMDDISALGKGRE